MPSLVEPPPSVSPLMLADRIITLAQDVERAGYRDAASDLVTLVYAMLDETPLR